MRRSPSSPAPDHRATRRRRAARSGSFAARRSRPTAPRQRRSCSRRPRSPGNRKPGDWGGIIIIGNGIINRTGSPILTEGGAAGVAENYAGGTDNNDNSGTLRYVRIEFAGYDVSNGAGQELNTLSSYAVGRGTTYEYIQSMAGLDDSFEWWGGAVDGRYLVSYESGDDHFDWTEGYQGRNQFMIAFQSTRLTPRRAPACCRATRAASRATAAIRPSAGCTVTADRRQHPVLDAGVRQLHHDRHRQPRRRLPRRRQRRRVAPRHRRHRPQRRAVALQGHRHQHPRRLDRLPLHCERRQGLALDLQHAAGAERLQLRHHRCRYAQATNWNAGRLATMLAVRQQRAGRHPARPRR